jgi:hypothetical protein
VDCTANEMQAQGKRNNCLEGANKIISLKMDGPSFKDDGHQDARTNLRICTRGKRDLGRSRIQWPDHFKAETSQMA